MTDIDYAVERKRRKTAEVVANKTGYAYSDVLYVLQKLGVHGNWTPEELNNRPVDYDELAEIVAEEIESFMPF